MGHVTYLTLYVGGGGGVTIYIRGNMIPLHWLTIYYIENFVNIVIKNFVNPAQRPRILSV
jgi:hypothetical protein